MKKLYLIYKRFKTIDWKKGNGIILFYIAMMWLIVLAFILFVEFYHAFSLSGNSQILADLVADGSAFIANSGWGLDEDEATDVAKTLIKLNKTESLVGDTFEDMKLSSKKYSYTDSDGSTVSGQSTNNTVTIKIKWDSSILTDDSSLSTKTTTSTAKTRITYSGGMQIVLEAWKHTYQCLKSDTGQTWYVWGGGHGTDDSWEQFADCSGFVSGVYRACGYDVPNWACTWTFETMGTLIGTGLSALNNAQPGDIILYWWGDSSGSPSHVAIYAGEHNGTYYQIHCSGTSSYSYSNPGKGSNGRGAVLSKVSTGAAKIMVRRLVGTNGIAYDANVSSISGMDANESTIYFALSSLGYSDIAIAAIMGNLKAESGCCPTVRQNHPDPNDSYNTSYTEKIKTNNITKEEFSKNDKTGYGLAQWTDQSRKELLYDYCGGEVSNIYMQVSFIDYELQYYSTFDKNYNALYSCLQNSSTTLETATRKFFDVYEGAKNNTFSARYANAREYYEEIQNYKKSNNILLK